MKKIRRRIMPRADINVTPFIDILLVLLVIFMTISPNLSKGVHTNIPQPPPPDSATVQKVDTAIVLSMSRTGVIKINQMEVEPSQLMAQLQDIFKSREDRTIFVQADNDLLFNDVAQLIDAAKTAGVDQLGLMTEHISSK